MVIFYVIFILNIFLINYAWYNKGNAFDSLGKYEKAIEWQFFI